MIIPSRAHGSFAFYNNGYDEQEVHQAIVNFVQQGRLDAGIWLDLEELISLADINSAFQKVRERRVIKAVVKISK